MAARKKSADLPLPRSTMGITQTERRLASGGNLSSYPNSNTGASFSSEAGHPSIPRTPSRKWYDPEYTGLSLLIPRDRIQLNRWRRYFYMREPIVGGVIDLHSELPHSAARLLGVPDNSILNHYETAVERVNLWATNIDITKEFNKIGEAYPYLRWDENEGNWSHIILQNPDFIDIEPSLFAEEEDKYYLTADPRIKNILQNNNYNNRAVKEKLPNDFVRTIMYGDRFPLPFDEQDLFVPLIRRSGPSDIRGTSLIDRLFKALIYEDKMIDAQSAIIDNFINPLRMFKIGNEKFAPNAEQLDAFQELVMNKQFDPNFYLITHNAVTYESHSLAADVMSLGPEYERIDKIKMIGLGISQAFITGESTYASAHVSMQTIISRYRTLRHMLESQFINKFFRIIAERNEFYKPSLKELNGQYRDSARRKDPNELLVPRLDWEKKLTIREEESYLNFLSGLMGKMPISQNTFFSALGLSFKDELLSSQEDETLQKRLGIAIKKDLSGKDTNPDEEGGDEGGESLFGRIFKRKQKFAEKDPTEYLKKIARNIVILEKAKGVTKTYEEVLSGLLAAEKVGVNENDPFLTGYTKRVNDSLIKPKEESEKPEVAAEVSAADRYLFNSNYTLNYNSYLPTKIKSLLKDVDLELNKEVINKGRIESAMESLIRNSMDDAKRYINNKSMNTDREFIAKFLQSDLLDSFNRVYSDQDIDKLEIKKLCLAAVVLGYTTHYGSEDVEYIRVFSENGIFSEKLSSIYASGISSIQTYVQNGIIPAVYPLIIDTPDELKKFSYITDFTVSGVEVQNCPKYMMSGVSSYLTVFSKQIDTSKVSKIIFSDNITKLPEFLEYTKHKYSMRKSTYDQVIVENERIKTETKKYFASKDTIYINYSFITDFNTISGLMTHFFPVDLQKYSALKFPIIADYLKMSRDNIRVAVTEKWAAIDGVDYPFRFTGNSAYNLRCFADYIDESGAIKVDNKELFTENIIQAYFDKKYLFDSKISDIIEKQ
jgi:hypothetical protein